MPHHGGMTPAQLGDRDGWVCWLCGNGVDADAARGAPYAGSIDHVVPRAKGGGDEPANLRLAHRSCNGRRGSRLPELDWPRDLPVVDATPLWPVVQRALRRRGDWEGVGVLPTGAVAREAVGWLSDTLRAVLGDEWEVRRTPVSATGLQTLALRVRPVGDAGAPRRSARRRQAPSRRL